MKSLLVSLLFVTFAQSTFAAPPPLPMDLNEADSKVMYNVLADWGTRQPDPAEKRTNIWVNQVLCVKETEGSNIIYGCKVYDVLHSVELRKVGDIAKRLYEAVGTHRGIQCRLDSPICATSVPVIKCTHWWDNKHNPPVRRFQCRLENLPERN